MIVRAELSCQTLFQVALRIRPLVPKELREGCQPALELVPNEPQVNRNRFFLEKISLSLSRSLSLARCLSQQRVYCIRL